MEDNRRKHPRNASYIIGKYKVLEGTFRNVIINIRAGGLSIRTNRKVTVGQPITIEFSLFNFDSVMKITGRIVRRDLAGLAVTFNEPIHGLVCKECHFTEIVHERDR